MASITITIPDAQVTRVTTALCTIAGVAVSNANAKQILVDYIKATVIGFENDQNRSQAIAALPTPPDPGLS